MMMLGYFVSFVYYFVIIFFNFQEKSIYEELAEKEQALQLAAQFGKTLIEEKEQLEYQIEVIKKEYQNKIEVCSI